jgi:hypothetical protein
MSHYYKKLDDIIYFWFAANDTSGSGDDGGTPAAHVRLAGAAAGATPVHSITPTLLTHVAYPAGLHEIAITASSANGYANGNTYGVYNTILVDSQNPSGFVGSFELAASGGFTQLMQRVRNNASFIRHGVGSTSWPLGVPYFWDPSNGNDSSDGLTAETAKLTFAATLALTTAYNHDSVIVVNSTGAALVIDAKLNVNVAKVHLIGDRNTTIKPTSVGASTAILSAIGAHLEGLNIETHSAGNEDAIEITADKCQAHWFNVPQSRGSGVVISGANDCTIHNFIMRDPGSGGNGHGVQITGSSTGNQIHDFDIAGASGDGINLNGANVQDNFIASGDGSSIVHDNTGWGIREVDADNNHISGPNLTILHNTAGNLSLNSNTVNENTTQYARFSDLPANFSDLAISVTTGLVNILQAAADKVWTSSETITEPSAGAPPAEPVPKTMFGWLWAHFRNKGILDKTGGTTADAKIHNDAGAVLAKGEDTDDGTTYTKGKLGAP